MKFLSILPLFLLAGQSLPLAHAAEGADALAAGLWEIAELHFKEDLANQTLAPEAKAEIAIQLAEALVRGGNPTAALELLAESFVAKHPSRRFWHAQALAGLNRYSEAIDTFSELLRDPAAAHRTEAARTQANLQLALELPDAALATLEQILPSLDEAASPRILLQQIEILLDLGRHAEARKIFPSEDKLGSQDRALAAFLNARLLQSEGRPAEAATAFQALLNQDQDQPLTRHHAAAIGLAECSAAQGQADLASASLLSFIQENPESPLLDSMFRRIVAWLPERLPANDLSLERLAQWISPPLLPAIGPIANHPEFTGAAAAWPTASPTDPLLAHALHARAIGLHRVGTPEAKAEARRLLNRLRLENPSHPLTEDALYHLARWDLNDGKIDQAFSILDTLRSDGKSPTLKGGAAFIEARVAFENGDSKLAIALFDEAAASLTGADSRTAKIQSAIAKIRSAGPAGSTLIQQSQPAAADKVFEADLELERALSTQSATARLSAIDEFLTRFPSHPRAAEARLAATEAALTPPSTDLAFARAQLDALDAAPAALATLPPARVALARLRVADLSNDSAATLSAAQTLIERFPEQAESYEASLTLGRNLFQAGDYNPARLVLEKLAASDPDAARAQVAWLLAARAAALGGTPQSKEEALILFDKAIEAGGTVTSIATLEKARHLIDSYQLGAAIEFLRSMIGKLSENDPLHLPAGLLLGEALYAQGRTDPQSLVAALGVYDQLLSHAQEHPSLLNRLQYLRGITLEQVPDEKDPTRKREKEAFQAFHSVLETTKTPVEWEYFERCGFRALALLEKAERWPVAITVAKKIASFNGPRAAEAATRASQLQLEHRIWED